MENSNEKNAVMPCEKKYILKSSKGMRFGWATRIEAEAILKDDRLDLNIKPKKLNTMPVILYCDILKIDTGIKLSWFYIIMAAFSLIGALSSPFMLIVTALCVYLMINHQVIISHRGGHQVKLYTMNKSEAIAFAEDLRHRIS